MTSGLSNFAAPGPMAGAEEGPRLARRSPAMTPAAVGVALCLLLAVAQVALGGYQFGVGNQSIQIAFLKRFADPLLYSRDTMVNETMPLYPSYFFRMLAPLLKFIGVGPLYLALQMVTSFLTLVMVYALGRAMFRSHGAGLLAALLLVAGHLSALAGDALYSPGFTHTYAALPLAIGALALAYRGRWPWAFALAGVLFNVHALTAAYVLVMLGAGLLADMWGQSWWKWGSRAVLCEAIALVLAAPTLVFMAHSQQIFDAAWINLMRMRSGEHSFPTTWWAAGNADVPLFALVMALFALSLSFIERRMEERREKGVAADDPGARPFSRMTLLMTAGVLVLFLAGYLFTEVWPLPLVIRLQPFRASRLLMVVMLVSIAHGAMAAMRAGILGTAETASAAEGDVTAARLAWPMRILEMVTAALIIATLAIPSLLPLLPITVLLATLTALVAGHLSWRQAVVCAGACVVAIVAHRQIEFPLWPRGLDLMPHVAEAGAAAIRMLGFATLAIAGAMALLLGLAKHRPLRAALVVVTLADGVVMAGILFSRINGPALANDDLARVAAWARESTPRQALFLTQGGLSNFRILAERSLVGDWRDGTQLYFSSAYGPDWLKAIQAVQPGLTISGNGQRVISPGEPLETLDDKTLITLAGRLNAAYVVLPTDAPPPPGGRRELVAAYSDEYFTVYEPRVAQVKVDAPKGVYDPDEWNAMEKFMATTVPENIEKYRKAEVSLVFVDAAGKPLRDVPVKLDQTQQAFVFGVSLSFFESNNYAPSTPDPHPPVVRPVELEKMPEVFNGSMIAFSSKWQYIEPEKGEYHWSDLDKYVDYCTQHDITMEFHHLSGIVPEWMQKMGAPEDGQTGLNFSKPIPAVQAEFTRHCLDTVARYADRIKYFQVVNEKYMMQYVPTVFKELQKRFPNNQFGLSDCIRFWDSETAPKVRRGQSLLAALLPLPKGGPHTYAQYKGFDAVEWLNKQGIKPDFFSAHGHYPMGLWADPREMYNVFEHFEKAGVKVHISEEFVALNQPMYGPARAGTWTPELQADYLTRLLTVAFSHPNVDMVNLWGISSQGWAPSNGLDTGLIDAKGKPRPVWEALKKLFTEKWRSHAAETLAADGKFTARVFHGTYKISVNLPNGKTVTTSLVVPQKPAASFRLRVDAEKGTLEVAP